MEVSLHSFVISALTGGKRLIQSPHQFTPGKISRQPLNIKRVEPQMRPGELGEEINLLPRIETRFLECPVRIPATVCTDCAISAHTVIINVMLECTQLCNCTSRNSRHSAFVTLGIKYLVGLTMQELIPLCGRPIVLLVY